MRAPQERTMRDLYDRTRHKDLAAPQEPAEGCVGGRRELVARMEDKSIVRKKLVSNDNIRVKAESGTCNVCCAPCSSCLHRSLAHADSNVDCGSSQTCSTRSEIKNNSLTPSEKGFRNQGENDDEFSAASSNASYSETGGNKVVSRSSIAEDSEVDMPAKRRRLSNEGMKLSRTEYLDGNNSCVTGMPAEGKLLKKKRLSTSASSRDLTIKDRKDNSVASLSRLRKQHADESTEKNRSDVMHLSSSVNIKKLIRTQSSVSVSKGLSPKRQVHELGEAQENLSHEHCEKASISNNIVEQTRDGTSNPFVDVGDNNVMLTGCSGSMKNEIKARLSPKNLEIDSFSKDQIQQHAIVQINDDSKKNGVDKQERDQDSSMDICNDGKLNRQNDVMTDCGNSEGLIDVNVCDICGDVGREYLLATCTRCLEGAEHTYCMRVKLDRVPDGEWLCEECQLKDDHSKTKCKYDVRTVSISEGKKQSLDSQNSHKTLRVVVPNLDTLQINCNTPTADQCDAKKKKLHLPSADTLPRQVKVTNPAAERLEARNKNLLSMANRKKLQVVTSDLEAQSHTSGIPTPGSSNKKNQSSEFQLNRKKLRVSTDTESPLSSEGLRSPSISCKRLAENTSSPTRLFTANNLKKRDVFSRENSFKKSNEGNLSSLDNASVRNSQAVKSSQTLSRSYSMGSMLNSKAPVPSPRGILSKQLSFNSSNNGPKVKQLAEGIASKLKPVKHSPKDPRDQGPIKKLMKSGSFKSEGSVCKDAGSSKQKHSFHVSQDEKPVILKSMKEKNLMERRASFNLKKPNIPSSPRPESYMKSGERKLDQDIPRPGPSILKSSKRPGNVEKESFDLSKTDKRVHQKPAGLGNVEKGSSDLSKTDKHEISVHQKPVGLGDVEKESSDLSKTGKCETSVHQKAAGFISAKVIYTANVPDPPVPPQCVKRESNDGEEDSCIPVKDGNGMLTEPPSQCVKRESNDGEEDSSIPVKDGNEMPTEPPEVLPTTSDAMSLESDLQDIAPRVSASEELASKVLICQPKPLDSTLNSCNTVEAVQFSDDTLSECPHGLQIVHNGYPTDNKLDKPNLKQEALFDQSTPDNPSRDLVIPEQSYIWQGSFEVSRRGIPELFDGIQAYLSTCASFKVREVGKQLPHRIRLEEVPRHSSWPLQFKGVNPTEDNIALFFFAKDAESYERAYKRLLEDMLLGDLSLTANIDGTELLIFPSDKLPERTQRWNGLLFFWGIFYAHKASSLTELSVSGTNSCPLESVTEPEPVVQHDVCSPKVPHPLVIDLNQCPIDDLSDPAEPLGSEMKKTVTSIDQNIWLESKLEDRKLDACEIHQEETAGIRQIVSGHPTAAPCRTHFPKFPTDSRDMVKDYPSATKDTTGIAGNSNMEEEGFCQHGTLFCVPPQAGAIKSVSGEMVVKKQAFQPSVEASPRHFSGSKISNEPNKLAPNLGTRSSDSDSSYKRQKTSHGKYSACSFEELPNKCLSKIHPLPDGERNHDAQYIYRGHSDPASLRKPIPDHVIHVLSSDDEDSPEPSTSLNKASLKADAGSSPLLSLSLSTVATKHNLAGSDIGEDEPLSLSLGLPGVVDRSRVLEMKQFLPEKPGINT